MSDNILQRIIDKHIEDREVLKALRAKHAEELRGIEELQKKREDALLERGDMTCFAYLTDLFVNGRDGKAEVKKKEESISLDQSRIESWLLKMLKGVGEGIKTEFGTVYLTRKESVTCSDFEIFFNQNLLAPAVSALKTELEARAGIELPPKEFFMLQLFEHMHLEFLTKAVRKESVLELMGEQSKDGSRPNPPPAGVNYVAVQTVGVRKATK